MSPLVIQIDWQFFLGIIGSLVSFLIIIAWYGSARFTKIETLLEHIEKSLRNKGLI
jgi:putative solute:sodium symporter small subunit